MNENQNNNFNNFNILTNTLNQDYDLNSLDNYQCCQAIH